MTTQTPAELLQEAKNFYQDLQNFEENMKLFFNNDNKDLSICSIMQYIDVIQENFELINIKIEETKDKFLDMEEPNKNRSKGIYKLNIDRFDRFLAVVINEIDQLNKAQIFYLSDQFQKMMKNAKFLERKILMLKK